MKLYHYIHCPFCVRVRMGLNFLGLKFESIVLPYDDEKTPISLTGVKMLPITTSNDGVSLNESLDILKKADVNDLLNWKLLEANLKTLNTLLDKIGSPVHSMAMPYWVWTPEFNESSRKYFQDKKEVKRGPFKKLVQNQTKYVSELNLLLKNEFLSDLKPFYKNSTLTIMDIMLAAHLWGMYIVPEYQFDPEVHAYLQNVKAKTHFNYHEDYWR